MAFPIDPKEGFYRTPARYPHDAFGVDTGGRVRPHSGGDSTPTVANARGRSVLGGTVLRSGFTIYAGHYVEVLAPDGWRWLDLHFASRLVKAGDVVAAGDPIGVVGNTGGGGALGTKARIGRHVHTSRCRDKAAVDRIINGLVRARYKGESPEQWAAAHGLSDPYPHIVESVKARADKEGFLMALTDDEQADLYSRVKAIRSDQVAVVAGTEQSRAEMTLQQVNKVVDMLAVINGLADVIKASADDADALAKALVEPGPQGWSWAERIRSVAYTLEQRKQ